MKKILIFLMCAAVAVSCSDDIFDVDPSGKVSSETRDEVAKEDPDKVLQGIEASIYVHYATYYKNDLQWLTGFKGFELSFGMAGQDMAMLLQHSMNLYMYINDYWQEEYTPTFNVWNMFYIPIATANEILATATAEASAESETMKAYRARALTSRAFGYYHLINVYQYPYSAANKDLPGVPLATEETLGQNLPRATMEQVYKRITDDLDEALDIFEEIGYDDTGSRTDFDASVAGILRARVALVMEDWGKAVSLADDILAKYTLVSKENYNNGFNRIENVPSLIFGFKMTADNCQTWATWCSQMDPYMSGYAGMWAERPIHSYLYERLNKTDVRRGWWLNATDNPECRDERLCLSPAFQPAQYACFGRKSAFGVRFGQVPQLQRRLEQYRPDLHASRRGCLHQGRGRGAQQHRCGQEDAQGLRDRLPRSGLRHHGDLARRRCRGDHSPETHRDVDGGRPGVARPPSPEYADRSQRRCRDDCRRRREQPYLQGEMGAG